MKTTPILGAEPIKPCPFCGHAGLTFEEGSTFRWIVASCERCGATRGETRIQTLGDGSQEEWQAAAEADAIKEWNERAALSAPTEGSEPVAKARFGTLTAREALNRFLDAAAAEGYVFAGIDAADLYVTLFPDERERAAAIPTPDCHKPPHGWRCTRAIGHEGPCAAIEDTPPPVSQDSKDAVAPAYDEPQLGAIATEHSGKVELYPAAFRQYLLRMHRKGWEAAIASMAGQGGDHHE